MSETGITIAAKTGLPFTNGRITLTDTGQIRGLAQYLQANVYRKFKTVDECSIAILAGHRLGMDPLQACDAIMVVHGRAALYGDGIRAMVLASGLCEDIRTEYIGEGDQLACVVTMIRKGFASPVVGRFSVPDAKKAGLWGKTGPWTQYPSRMLMWRAFGFAARDGFADILGGLGVVEELQDYAPVAAGSRAVVRNNTLTDRIDAIDEPAPQLPASLSEPEEVAPPVEPMTDDDGSDFVASLNFDK